MYQQDLLRLIGGNPGSYIVIPLAFARRQAPTPLQPRAWEEALHQHPDRSFVDYILQGMRGGFQVGFQHGQVALKPAKRNIPSAYEQPQVVDKYLRTECQMGRIMGPFISMPVPELHVNRFGVIPKKSQPGKWHLIVDLSAPKGHSVNDGISEAVCSLRYPFFDLATRLLLDHGPGAAMSKLDIKEAYRMVPVHPADWVLLGMRWQGAYFVDTRLPFGLRSAPKIFTAIADALQWILLQRGIQNLIHYLDDFFFVELPGSTGKALEKAQDIMQN